MYQSAIAKTVKLTVQSCHIKCVIVIFYTVVSLLKDTPYRGH